MTDADKTQLEEAIRVAQHWQGKCERQAAQLQEARRLLSIVYEDFGGDLEAYNWQLGKAIGAFLGVDDADS